MSLIYVDVGTNKHNPDGHAWSTGSLGKSLKNPDNRLNILPDESLPGHSKPEQFILTGDEAFPLSMFRKQS